MVVVSSVGGLVARPGTAPSSPPRSSTGGCSSRSTHLRCSPPAHLMLKLLLRLLSSLASSSPSSPRCRRNLGLEVAGGLGVVVARALRLWGGGGPRPLV